MTLLAQVLAAAIGTIAFGTIFGVEQKYYFFSGMIGGAGWAVYVVLWQMLQCWSEPAVIFLATVLVVFLSRLCAVRKRCPATIFLISGILPLVPGAGIYWTSFYLVTNQLEQALARGFLAVKVAIAIVLGIVVVFEIPQGFFRKRD